MPLAKGYTLPTIRQNIVREIQAGKPVEQSTAIAYAHARLEFMNRHPGRRLPAHLRRRA